MFPHTSQVEVVMLLERDNTVYPPIPTEPTTTEQAEGSGTNEIANENQETPVLEVEKTGIKQEQSEAEVKTE